MEKYLEYIPIILDFVYKNRINEIVDFGADLAVFIFAPLFFIAYLIKGEK